MEPWQTIMLVGGIVVVSAVVLPRRAGKDNAGGDSQTVRNMETALEQFMENLEADNREIADLVSKSSEESHAQAVKRDERVGQLEKRIAEMEQRIADQAKQAAAYQTELGVGARLPSQSAQTPSFQLSQQTAAARESIEEDEQVIPFEESPTVPSIRSRYAELFEMHQAGKSIEMIAKKLGRNKGEVQLILQLSKQEEAVRHE